jgi:uncharacterized protein
MPEAGETIIREIFTVSKAMILDKILQKATNREIFGCTMLINFSLQNFRSFGEEQTLTMLANTKETGHANHLIPIEPLKESALRLAILYGPNAGGKSSLVQAMDWAQRFIRDNIKLISLAQHRHRFGLADVPTSIEFIFLENGSVYTYGFDVTVDTILEEWLTKRGENGREVTIYERNVSGIHAGKFSNFEGTSTLKTQLDAFKSLGIRADQLLLTKLLDLPLNKSQGVVADLTSWFKNTLQIVPPDAQYISMLDRLGAADDFRENCGQFLNHIGTGIQALVLHDERLPTSDLDTEFRSVLEKGGKIKMGSHKDLELAKDNPDFAVRRSLTAEHQVNGASYPIPFHLESDGTQRSLHLLPMMDTRLPGSRVYVVDEFDRSLHPLVSRELLRVFTNSPAAAQNQLIVTTHESNLLDQELIRRDEVWFVEKDQKQQSRLSSLNDYNVRNDLRLDKGYLQGRFGGIPFIGDSAKLMKLLERTTEKKPRAKKKTPTQA